MAAPKVIKATKAMPEPQVLRGVRVPLGSLVYKVTKAIRDIKVSTVALKVTKDTKVTKEVVVGLGLAELQVLLALLGLQGHQVPLVSVLLGLPGYRGLQEPPVSTAPSTAVRVLQVLPVPQV
jgi:hypothetical protein